MDHDRLFKELLRTYLKLTAEENKAYERALSKFDPETKDATMELITSWHRAGREEGRHEGRQEGREVGREEGLHQGKEELVALQLSQRFGTLPAHITEQLDRLTSDQLNALAIALLSFGSLDELESWLAEQLAQ